MLTGQVSSLQRVALPGQGVINLTSGGTYVVYYEGRGAAAKSVEGKSGCDIRGIGDDLRFAQGHLAILEKGRPHILIGAIKLGFWLIEPVSQP